jgi:glycosyltransferase involved in cell wall biosynthesis
VRLVVDAASAELGGIRTYVDRLLPAWAAAFPDDRLLVVVPPGSTIDTAGHDRHELRVTGPGVVGRPVAQTRALPRLARAHRADAVLATNPTTTLRRPGAPLAVVVHDLRHELRPEQFSRGRRALRWGAYRRSYALADGFVAVSQRTLGDLHRLHPGTAAKPGAVVHHGADHVLGWPAPDRTGPAVAFGHHTNKNPQLVVAAWAVLARDGEPPRLRVLGLSGETRRAVAAQVAELGLGPWVELSGYLPEDELRSAIARADLVVLPSDLEGFGLPVVEGMALGKPVVVGPDPGTAEVAAGHASTAADWSPEALADAVRRARALGPDALAAARAHGEGFTWDRAVRGTRRLLQQLAEGAP